jgi:hypothetical protein
MADGVDARVDPMQPAGVESSVDRVAPESERKQLPPGDDAVLPPGELRQLLLDEFPRMPGVLRRAAAIYEGLPMSRHSGPRNRTNSAQRRRQNTHARSLTPSTRL